MAERPESYRARSADGEADSRRPDAARPKWFSKAPAQFWVALRFAAIRTNNAAPLQRRDEGYGLAVRE